MSKMPESADLPTCPGCEEPLESGDRFCGACGYDLSAVPPRPADQPTLVMNAPGPARPGATAPGVANAPDAADVRWPAAAGTDSSAAPAPALLPDELPGLDSAGGRLSAHPGDFELPAPRANAPGSAPAAAPVPSEVPSDPRTAGPVPAAPTVPAVSASAGAKLCVACRAGRVDTDGYCENCGHAQPRERDHVEQELGAVAAVSDRGLRHHRNEDAFAVSCAALPDGTPAVVAVVCDGVSSATRPDEASAAAAASANESLLESLARGTHPQQAMHEAIVVAAEAVNSLAPMAASALDGDPHRHRNAPACTIVGAVVASGLLVIGWIGDSRAYWVPDDRQGPPARLTEDDSWAAQMVAAGLMNEAEAYADERAHAITGWLGADAYELEPHTASFKPDRPGVVVVCTDGLWNYAEGADEMARALPADAARRPLHAAQVLVGHALDGGGHDNVTVAVLPFAVPPQGAGSAYNAA
ncbi:protein phosphatase 2C domain-containing protein [Streptomyces sp. NPDC059743]|uniref:PP2C family serine/threonine-protein phosphatase n=1 Tax=Streptomyces sp. NPDC059743 TaxID=3346928 RepID=UPI003651F11F